MKSIVKPIKRGRITGSALATVILTGALAVTASGCTAEIKMADGTPVGTVVINDEALASGISINQQGVNADVITDPAIQLPADDFDTDITPSVSVPEESKETEEPEVTEPTAAETTAAPTKAPATDTLVPVNNDKKRDFSKIKNGTVIHFDVKDNVKEYKVSGDYGEVSFTVNAGTLRYETEGNKLWQVSISSERVSYAYLIKENDKTYLYVDVVRGNNNNETNIYEIKENSISCMTVLTNFTVSPSIDNTKNFKGYDADGAMFCSERQFKIGKDGLPVPADNMSYIGSVRVVAARDLTGYLVSNGKKTNTKMTIKAGESVTPTWLNEVEYIDLKDANKNTIRVDFTDECCKYYDQNDYRWIYTALRSMLVEVSQFKASVNYLSEGYIEKFNDGSKCFWAEGCYGKLCVETLGNNMLRITNGKKTYDLNIKYGDSGYALSSAYLFKQNGKAYIYVTTVRKPGNASDLNVYELTDDSVKYVGTVENLLIRKFENTKSFSCYEDYGNNYPFLITRNYKVAKNGLAIPADNYSQFEWSTTFRAARDMEGKIVRDGKVTDETKKIKTDDLITPVAVNEVEYIDFKDASGDIIRVDFTNECCTYYDQNDYRWIRPAILSMVKDV